MSLTPEPEHRLSLSAPDLGDEELAALRRVLESRVLTNGPESVEFEQAFAARHDVAHAVSVANGTLALSAVWHALDVDPGDEVIVPSFTFISSATSIRHVGASPVFADIRADTFNLDPADVATRITPRTRAILAVHYGGQPADMDELRELADQHGIALVEDAAEAHGAEYRGRPVGSLADAAIFSFTPTKNITTGEGGMVTTADADIARTVRLLRNHGFDGTTHTRLGYNWRLTELQAALGRVQLEKLDRIIDRKRHLAELLSKEIATIEGITAPTVLDDRRHVFMLYTVLVDQGRDELLDQLEDLGIQAKLYFPPAHLQPVFADVADPALPTTEWVAARALTLPLPSTLPPGEVAGLAEALRHAEAAIAPTS